jgi:hypothetical protein
MKILTVGWQFSVPGPQFSVSKARDSASFRVAGKTRQEETTKTTDANPRKLRTEN